MNEQVSVLEVNNLVVDYGKGNKKHRAVDGISFNVKPGECVGFIGANGAGKSTTMKALMGFLFPTSGTVQVFGKTSQDSRSRQRIGYLPEVALYYPFMKAKELLQLYGGLHGLSSAELRQRIPKTLERVGLGGKDNILLKNFSKGMQQRLGIAQAIIAEPEALIFDELSSGLDPVGRFDLRDVLIDLKSQGRTIFFSSHELSEVESLCDRVIMIHKGKIVTQATVEELMKPLNQFQVVYKLPVNTEQPTLLSSQNPERLGDQYTLQISDVALYAQTITELSRLKAEIVSTESKSRSLEEYFIELVRKSNG